jgi:hypothetical protein
MATNPKADLKKALPIFAKNLSSIKLSLTKLVKNKEDEKKQRGIDRQKQRTSDYAAKYRKTPTPAEKKVVEQEKKPFLQSIKDFFAGLLKFLVLGLGAIGLAKLLSNPAVTSAITNFLKKVFISLSEALQKGLQVITNLINDPEVFSSIQKMVKDTFIFISKLVVKGAEFIRELVTDPEIQDTIKNVLVGVISTVKEIIVSVFDVGKTLVTENREVIKTTIIDVIVGIANAFVKVLKIGEDVIKDKEVKKALVDIAYAIRDAIKTIFNAEFEIMGVKTNLKQVLFGLGVAVMGFGLALTWLQGKIIGGMIADKLPGGKSGGRVRGKAGAASTAVDVSALTGTGFFAGRELYDQFVKDDSDLGQYSRYVGGDKSLPSAPTTTTAPSKTSTFVPTANENRPTKAIPGTMPASLEEYVAMEFDRKKAREGFRNKAYASPEGGEDTIGIGHKLSPEEQKAGGVFIGGQFVKADRNTPLTDQQVKDLYIQDIMKHAAGAKRRINKLAGEDVWKKLNPMQQYALMDLSFAGGGRMITQDLANAIKANDMGKAAQIIQSKGRTYMKNGEVIKSKHHEKHADLRADIFRGNDPLLTGGTTTLASYTPNEQRQSKPIPTPNMPSMPTMASASGKEPVGHSYSPGSSGPEEDKTEQPKSMVETLLQSLSQGIAGLDKATGGKLGLASTELQTVLRDKSFLEAFQAPVFTDASKNVSTSEGIAMDEKTPSIYDEVLLSKMSRA